MSLRMDSERSVHFESAQHSTQGVPEVVTRESIPQLE